MNELLRNELVSRSRAEQEAIVVADEAIRADSELLAELDALATARYGFLPLTALPSLPNLPSEAVTYCALTDGAIEFTPVEDPADLMRDVELSACRISASMRPACWLATA